MPLPKLYLATEGMLNPWSLHWDCVALQKVLAADYDVELIDWFDPAEIAKLPQSGTRIYPCSWGASEIFAETYGIERGCMYTFFRSAFELVEADLGRSVPRGELVRLLRNGYLSQGRAADQLRARCMAYRVVGVLNQRHFRFLSGLSNLHCVPQAVDPDVFKPITAGIGPRTVVAWAGKTTCEPLLKDLALLEEVKDFIAQHRDDFVYNGDAIKTREHIGFGLQYAQMPEFYNGIDILLVTSVDEGGPRPALEALACGCQVVSTACGHMPELAKLTSAVTMVEPDSAAFAKTLLDLRAQPHRFLMPERRRLARIIHEHRSWSAVRPRWLEFFREEPKMPTSAYPVITAVLDEVLKRNPRSVLDVGCGSGKYGVLFREYLDIWAGRLLPQDWQTRIDAVEVFPKYITPVHDHVYDKVIQADVMEQARGGLLGTYDVVFMGDVIEHFEKDDAVKIIEMLRDCGTLILTTPVHPTAQAETHGNPHEAHRSVFSLQELQQLGADVRTVGDKLLAVFGPKTAPAAMPAPEPAVTAAVSEERWLQAQKFERDWQGDCVNLLGEENKQQMYAKHMGLKWAKTFQSPFSIDMQGRSVLDIGGGPNSMLLKCRNVAGTVVDPIEIPSWCRERYSAAGICCIRMKAEEFKSDAVYDEVWLYNVLQHVIDPAKVLETAFSLGRRVRFCEWLNIGIDAGHPHTLTREKLIEWEPRLSAFSVTNVNSNDCVGTLMHGVFDVRPIPAEQKLPVVVSGPDPDEGVSARFHLLGIPHLPTCREIRACAYTQKVWKLAHMLKSMGETVFFYGGEGSNVECDEFVPVVTNADRKACYGEYDWHTEFFKHAGDDMVHRKFNHEASVAINARKRPNDFLLIPWGNYQKPVADAVQLWKTVESGIGYEGIFAKYRVFESYAWLHWLYGAMKARDGHWYDAVIPNYFDPEDFPFEPNPRADYCLYIGRLCLRKGLHVAVQATKHIGMKLIVAGQGSLVNPTEQLDIHDTHVEHIGCVDAERRADLMSNAYVVFAPTYYVEPFGGVNVEAQMCGTPVITTDWGAFTETVLHGITGYRCRVFDDVVKALALVPDLDRGAIHNWAVANYSMSRVGEMYETYFRNINDLEHKAGWNLVRDGGLEPGYYLNWLTKQYPHVPEVI